MERAAFVLVSFGLVATVLLLVDAVRDLAAVNRNGDGDRAEGMVARQTVRRKCFWMTEHVVITYLLAAFPASECAEITVLKVGLVLLSVMLTTNSILDAIGRQDIRRELRRIFGGKP